jgi:amino acid permease
MVTQNIIRALLVITTALVAILAPYFGEVLGTVGGLTDALQSFCLPPLICMNMGYRGHMKLSGYRKAFYRFVILWGIGTICHTITILVKAIIVNV